LEEEGVAPMVELEYERLVEVLRWAFGERVVIEV